MTWSTPCEDSVLDGMHERLVTEPTAVPHQRLARDAARVSADSADFLRHRGAIQVGRGSVTEDVRRAHELRGTEHG